VQLSLAGALSRAAVLAAQPYTSHHAPATSAPAPAASHITLPVTPASILPGINNIVPNLKRGVASTPGVKQAAGGDE
jgi:hypothetical protein